MSVVNQPKYAVGSLVRTRGRDWVVVPSDEDEILKLRPLSGSEQETIGVLRQLEEGTVEDSVFPAPEPSKAGDFVGSKLLRNAARLSLRSVAHRSDHVRTR